MLVLLSPAKKMNFSDQAPLLDFTTPERRREINVLMMALKRHSAQEIADLMSVSEKIAQLNYDRYQSFDSKHFTLNHSKAAIFAFEGEAYRHLDVMTLTNQQIQYMQNHLLILSGLYGYLRPLDLIQPYRLEMSTKLVTSAGDDLYQFWNDKITQGINAAIEAGQHRLVLNLASQEYFKAVQLNELSVPVITVQFKEKRGNQYKTFGMNAKRARGMMTRFVMIQKIKTLSALKKFNEAGYAYQNALSQPDSMCFVR